MGFLYKRLSFLVLGLKERLVKGAILIYALFFLNLKANLMLGIISGRGER